MLDTTPTRTSDPLSAVLVSGPSHGTLTLNANGSFYLHPACRTITGSDSFTYRASDGTLTFERGHRDDHRHRNQAPTADDDAYSTA